MTSILNMLTEQLGDDAIGKLSRTLGADEKTTSSAITAALPALLGALAKNTSNEEGAEGLSSALNRDHDGSILDSLSGFLGQGDTSTGDGILGHLLGNKRSALETGLGKASGMDSDSAGKLLAMLAPIVMGSLGKVKQQNNLDTNALAGMLANEDQELKREQPQAMGMLSNLLDSDGDGDLDLSDFVKHGKGLLGSLLKR